MGLRFLHAIAILAFVDGKLVSLQIKFSLRLTLVFLIAEILDIHLSRISIEQLMIFSSMRNMASLMI